MITTSARAACRDILASDPTLADACEYLGIALTAVDGYRLQGMPGQLALVGGLLQGMTSDGHVLTCRSAAWWAFLHWLADEAPADVVDVRLLAEQWARAVAL